ncbi:MAG: type VI secretion system tube protein Hcp [Rhodothermales bacterium]|nr:type VI secretion system tube protein Hcp [Rhodothermales bacterium]
MKETFFARAARSCVWMALSFIMASPSFSAVYIYVNGLAGESLDEDHAGWSDVSNWSFEIGAADALRRSAAFTDILIVKELDSMSNGLAEAAIKGTVFSDVTLHMTASYTDAGRVVYYEIFLTNVRVASYSIAASGNDGAEPPMEEMTLSFEQATVKYHQLGGNGVRQKTIEFSWRAS